MLTELCYRNIYLKIPLYKKVYYITKYITFQFFIAKISYKFAVIMLTEIWTHIFASEILLIEMCYRCVNLKIFARELNLNKRTDIQFAHFSSSKNTVRHRSCSHFFFNADCGGLLKATHFFSCLSHILTALRKRTEQSTVRCLALVTTFFT